MTSIVEDGVTRHRISVDEYYRMAEVGLLAPDARVELIEGEIVDMAPIGSRHGGAVYELTRLLVRAVGDRAVVLVQGPIRLGRRSEPQPDLALLRPRADGYKRSHPTAADVLLVIEVSDTTLKYDLQTKVPLYARHGITAVWVFDLENKRLRTFRTPSEGRYLDVAETQSPGLTPLPGLDGLSVELDAVLSS
jgi:Uma2 family endonuclease